MPKTPSLLNLQRLFISWVSYFGGLFGSGLIAVAQTTSKPEYPSGVAVGNHGVIYIIDEDAPAIFRVSEGDKLAIVYKGNKKSDTPVYRPKALVQDNAGNLFVLRSWDNGCVPPDGTKLIPLTGEKLDSKETGSGAKSLRSPGKL